MGYILGFILLLSDILSQVEPAPGTKVNLRPYSVSEFPSRYSEPVEYVVITRERFKPAFDSLIEWKRKKGINSVIRTINWIESNYSGSDLPARIRNFLRSAYYEWGTKYVLLGGDLTEVPSRRVRSTNHYGGYYEITSDIYYSCLNSSWNANGNEWYGEIEVDSTDYTLHLYIGRLLGSTVEEIEVEVSKTLMFEKHPEYENKALFIAGALSSGGIQSAEHCRQIANCFPDYFRIDSLFEKDSIAGQCVLTKQAVIDSLERNYPFVYIVSHGSQTQDFDAPISIGRADIDNLSNFPSFITTVSCYINWVDVNCLSRHFMLNPNGGSFAFRGTSRAGWAPQEQELNMYFYCDCGLFDKDSTTEIGKLDVYARRKTMSNFYSGGKDTDNNSRDTFLSYILLGDPELRLWRDIPDTLILEFPEVVDIGEGEFKIAVRNQSSEPLPNTRVCISRKDEIYAKGETDQNGEITFVLCPESAGLLRVVGTHQDFLPQEGYIFVNPTLPFVRYKRHFVDKPLEAGESIKLSLSLENTGAIVASNVKAKLSANSSFITLIDTIQDYGNILPGQNKTIAYGVEVHPLCPPKEKVSFNIISSYTGGSSKDTFNLVFIAPLLSHHSHYLDKDSIPQEVPINLSFMVRNSGNSEARKVIAYLTTLSPEISITDSIEELGFIPAFKVSSNPNSFTFIASGLVEEPEFILTLRDTFLIEWVDTFSIKFPRPPDTVWTCTRPDGASILWPAVEGMFGYNVYRLPDSELLNFNLITENPIFTDRELNGYEGHFYAVTGVDSELNESRFSSQVQGRANPDFKPGWPQLGLSPTTCFNGAPAVGDIVPSIPGLEIAINGSDSKLYVWHSNGEGVLSLDGVFADNLGGCWTSPAIGDIDNDGTLEVVRVQSFSSDENLYVFKKDGTQAPGFPVQLLGDWGAFASPALQDLDGDGMLEIIVVGSSSGKVYVFRADGSGFLGSDGFFGKMENGHTFGAPGVADIDNDGMLEIITGGTGWLYAWKPNGELLPNWPVQISGEPSSPAIGDLDREYPGLEIAIYTSMRELYIFHADGTIFWNGYCSSGSKWTRMSHPAIGDIDMDGTLEVVISGENTVYLWDAQLGLKALLFIPMMDVLSRSSAIIADIDGDDTCEIIVATLNEGNIYAIKRDGRITSGFPLIANGLIDGTATIADIDNDGENELIIGTNTPDVRVWGVRGNKIEWGTFAHDRWHTGLYGFVPPDTILVATEEKQEVFCFRLFQNTPNPFRKVTSIKYQIPCKSKVSLKIYDVAGRLVCTLVNEELAKGHYAVKWAGKNTFGNEVARGIYFYRLEVVHHGTDKSTVSKKLILL